jgi:hypothetical protein
MPYCYSLKGLQSSSPRTRSHFQDTDAFFTARGISTKLVSTPTLPCVRPTRARVLFIYCIETSWSNFPRTKHVTMLAHYAKSHLWQRTDACHGDNLACTQCSTVFCTVICTQRIGLAAPTVIESLGYLGNREWTFGTVLRRLRDP